MNARGKLNIVGIGPGSDAHVTPAAVEAIAEAQYVVGYTTYINLVRSRLEGKHVTRTGMTEEIGRAQTAVETARAGNVVTLISSGDAGVYGMAGLVFEVLRKTGWTRGDSPEVRLIPGITAANSCASLVGAPLVHDSCLISLSDLLTPWSVIAERLDCAARADFVISLYNPASGRRQKQIVQAASILRGYRPGTTPVALVKSAYRKQQKVVLSDLDHFLDFDIGMNTTVIIGNSNTFVYEGYMITPRGYTNKYLLADGTVRPGQRPGFSLKVETPNVRTNGLHGGGCKTDSLRAVGFHSVESNGHFREEMPRPLNLSSVDGCCLTPIGRLPNALQAHSDLARRPVRLAVDPADIAYADVHNDVGFMGRLAGAVLFKTQNRYFLIGDLKEPCDFTAYGLGPCNPEQSYAPMRVTDPQKAETLNFDAAVLFHGEEGAREIYNRFAVYRNSSISERLWTLVREASPRVVLENREYTDARWVAGIPLRVWNMVRSGILKCL